MGRVRVELHMRRVSWSRKRGESRGEEDVGSRARQRSLCEESEHVSLRERT